MATRALESTTRPQGGSLATTIPAEATRRMGLEPGGTLIWVEDGRGGYHVIAGRPEVRAALDAHEEIMAEYREVFQKLAQ